jgi:hypothetical protein
LIVTQQEEKAEKVQDLAVAYVDAFVGALRQDLVTLYMHHGMCHFLNMIRHVDLNISNMSQQWLEALLKQGKSNAKLFSNNQLRNGKMDKGRQAQIIAKERKRARLTKSNPMPLNRNEKRHLEGYELAKKAAKDKVDRAERQGQLKDSRSRAQMDERITKLEPSLTIIVDRFVQVRQKTAEVNRASARKWADIQAPLSASINVPGENTTPGARAGGCSGAEEAGMGAGAGADAGSAGDGSVDGAVGVGGGGGAGPGPVAETRIGEGGSSVVGSELLSPAGRGGWSAMQGTGRERGRGSTRGGAGVTAMSRSAPKSARMRR